MEIWISIATITAILVATLLAMILRRIASQQNEAGIATSATARFLRIGGMMWRNTSRKLRYRLRYLISTHEHRQHLKSEVHLQNAEEAAQILGNMKGVFMKIGQIVSFANESMPENARNAMQSLQQDAPPMAFSLVRTVVEEELSAELDTVFSFFDEEPLAAASIGQVHKATLLDGSQVAVKVQYPGVADAIRADLNASSMLATMINTVNKSIDAKAVVAELKERLTDELDYVREAHNQQLFYDFWRDHPFIRIPKVYHEYTKPRMLVQEFKQGLTFYDFLETANQTEKNTAVHVLMDFVYDSMFRFHVFNGDPHPGNYIFHEDGAITFLDFGCIKYFSEDLITNITSLSHTLLANDRDGFAQACRNIEIVLPDRAMDTEFLWEFFKYQIGPYLEDKVFTFNQQWLDKASEVMDIGKMQKINLPPDLIFFNRITFGLNAIFHKLGASANFHQMNRRYLFPEENIAPAVARLGITLEPHFITVDKAIAARPVAIGTKI